jgi:hypothetical protein
MMKAIKTSIDHDQAMKHKERLPSMAYLAVSYTGSMGKHCPRYRKELSFSMANAVAGWLIDRGELVYSPISHSHPIHDYMLHHADDHRFWMDYDDKMMEFCDRLYVIKSTNWEQSSGVQHEIEWFVKRGRPVFFIDINGNGGITMEELKVAVVNGRVSKVLAKQLNLFADLPLTNMD